MVKSDLQYMQVFLFFEKELTQNKYNPAKQQEAS